MSAKRKDVLKRRAAKAKRRSELHPDREDERRPVANGDQGIYECRRDDESDWFVIRANSPEHAASSYLADDLFASWEAGSPMGDSVTVRDGKMQAVVFVGIAKDGGSLLASRSRFRTEEDCQRWTEQNPGKPIEVVVEMEFSFTSRGAA